MKSFSGDRGHTVSDTLCLGYVFRFIQLESFYTVPSFHPTATDTTDRK